MSVKVVQLRQVENTRNATGDRGGRHNDAYRVGSTLTEAETEKLGPRNHSA